MATALKELFGLEPSKSGSGCIYVYCVADCWSRTITTTNDPKCEGLWVALSENESKLSIMVCEKTAHENECESQPTFTFYRNAVLELLDETSVLIADPFSMSCYFNFESKAQCDRFCSKVNSLLVTFAKHSDLERERQIYEANDYMDPFVHIVTALRGLIHRRGVIIEVDAGLGLVADAIMSASNSRYTAISRPGIAKLLNKYFRQTHGNGHAFSEFESEERYKNFAAVVSSRLIYSLFNCDILKRFLRFRDRIPCSTVQLLPTELMFCAGLIVAGDLCQEKRNKALVWLTTPFDVKLSDLYTLGLEEEFLAPEIGVSATKIRFVSDILESRVSLYDPTVTEQSVEEFDCKYRFRPKEKCNIDGIVLWCNSVFKDQVVSHTKIPPTSSITCLLDQSLEVDPFQEITVTCYFTVNHSRSYDIYVQYSNPPIYDCSAGYSLMLAEPNPFGKSLRREPDVQQSQRMRMNSEETRNEHRERSQQGHFVGVNIPRRTLASRGFLY